MTSASASMKMQIFGGNLPTSLIASHSPPSSTAISLFTWWILAKYNVLGPDQGKRSLARGITHEGPMYEMLWSDPSEVCGWGVSPRGARYTLGKDVTHEFNHVYDIMFIERAHKLVM